MNVVNTKTLEFLKITKGQTKLPHGGTILLDANKNPTGVLTDGFADLPGSPAPEEIAKYYVKDIPALWNAQGFTSILAITPAPILPIMKKVSTQTSEPNIRYTVSAWMAPNGTGFEKNLNAYEMPTQANPNYFKFAGIKAWVDGDNDCRTGIMYQPYEGHFDSDPEGGRGTLVTPQKEANTFVKLAHDNKRLAMLHCSGDAAVDIGLTAYEQSVAQNPVPNTIRRIEHFGMFQLTDTQLQRAKKLKKNGLHISSQPIWLLELVKADYENMGIERTKSGFKFKTMIDAGLEPAASTDMTGIYIGNINPYRAMYAMITRQSDDGIFEPQEALTVDQALKMWTIWPAKAIGESKYRGTIEVGKFADMAVLSDDIYAIPKENIKDVQASKTIVGGKVVYSR
jgi:predicted amidohydrolase YtcJ